MSGSSTATRASKSPSRAAAWPPTTNSGGPTSTLPAGARRACRSPRAATFAVDLAVENIGGEPGDFRTRLRACEVTLQRSSSTAAWRASTAARCTRPMAPSSPNGFASGSASGPCWRSGTVGVARSTGRAWTRGGAGSVCAGSTREPPRAGHSGPLTPTPRDRDHRSAVTRVTAPRGRDSQCRRLVATAPRVTMDRRQQIAAAAEAIGASLRRRAR
jgi:hypothetical protein